MIETLYKGTPRGREEIPEDEATKMRAEFAAAKIKKTATLYAKNRRNEYPSWQDQLDQIYHEGIDAWKETIKAVKDAHPKPE